MCDKRSEGTPTFSKGLLAQDLLDDTTRLNTRDALIEPLKWK
jgi:hypothetical protein